MSKCLLCTKECVDENLSVKDHYRRKNGKGKDAKPFFGAFDIAIFNELYLYFFSFYLTYFKNEKYKKVMK